MGAAGLALMPGCKSSSGAKSAHPKFKLKGREALDIAVDAYIFGFPLVKMELTRLVMTNVQFPEGMNAPMGRFARIRTYPPASNHDVTTPSTDMLYTGAWFDVTKEPWVVSIPDTQDRYCMFPLLDGWSTVFAAPGKRTTGTAAQQFAIVGPHWKGKLPPKVAEYRSATGIVWLLGRVACTGTSADYAAARAVQDGCSAVPLSQYGKPYQPATGSVDPSIDMSTPVRRQVASLDIGPYLNYLALLMKNNPPTKADSAIVKRMARLGIVPGQPFDINQLPPMSVEFLKTVPELALNKIKNWYKEGAKSGESIVENGWTMPVKAGRYGTDYLQRALVAGIGLGANLPQDTLYAISGTDGAGNPYTGNFRYVIHFEPDQLPPVNAFWSLTLYDGDYFFVDNALGRYSLGSRDDLKRNPDGSLDIYIQRHPPGAALEANWLPAAEEKFVLMLRMYWPKETLLKGQWKIPPVKYTG